MTASEPRTSDAGSGVCQDVCSLPAEELADRVAMIRREILPLVSRRETLTDGVALEFEHTPALQKTLEDLVVFERGCCSGLAWNLARPSSSVLRLSVQGLAADSDFFRALSPAPGGSTGGRLARVAQAAGLGAGAAFLLCCILPIGIGALAGAAVAAPFAKLDDPGVIAAGSGALALPAWLWLKRRAARSAEAGCTDGC